MLVAWGGGWLWIKGTIERNLDSEASRWRAAGGALTWSERRITGYPFRFDVEFRDLTWRGSDGWGFQTTDLKTETSVFGLGHWVAYAPAGLDLLRPKGGEIEITAKVLRASLSNTSAHPASFSLEGQGLTFVPVVGAQPWVIASADELHVHTRAGPSDQGAFLIDLTGARAPTNGRLATLASSGEVALSLDAIFDHADAVAGPGWTSAATAWASAGGKLQVRHLKFQAGVVSIEGQGAGVTLAPDGRLIGALTVRAGGLQKTIGLGTLSFSDGRTSLDSLDLGASPKVY